MSTINNGKDNGMWKGDEVSYNGLHAWIRKHKFCPDKCECCSLTKKLDLANISQEYKRDIRDWEWLCRRCHMTKDGRLKALYKRNKEVSHKVIYFSEDKKMIKLFQEISSKRKRNSKGHFIRKGVST